MSNRLPTRTSRPAPEERGWRRLGGAIVACALVAALGAGCGSSTSTGNASPPPPSTSASASASTSTAKSTVTKTTEPTDPADEICDKMVRDDLAGQLTTGKLVGDPSRTKQGTITTCTYTISGGGTMRLVVDEPGGNTVAKQVFDAKRTAATSPETVPNLGTEAFTDADGTTVTVKDDKVLTVDPTHLPTGNARTQIAQSLSFEVLSCWEG